MEQSSFLIVLYHSALETKVHVVVTYLYLSQYGHGLRRTRPISSCSHYGVCMYVSDKINYKLRKDLCHANSNYESCFIEIECDNAKNIVVGVIYRAHTSIDNFIGDIDPAFKKTK